MDSGTDTTSKPHTATSLGKPHNVILFDDNYHAMDEVAAQIVRATAFDPGRAWEVMMEAHRTGRAIVISAHKERCEHVAAVLEELRLGVKIEGV